MQEFVCGEIKPGEFEAVVKIAVEVFMNDRYFIKLYPNSMVRRKELEAIYQEGLNICHDNFGGTLVVRQDEIPVGFLMYFDYKKFRRHNLPDFKKVFGVNITYNKVMPLSFKKIHSQVMRMSESPVYVLAIGVGNKFQHQGIGNFLFRYFLEKFEGYPIMSDVSGSFFQRLCRRCGFKMRPISSICYLAVKESTDE